MSPALKSATPTSVSGPRFTYLSARGRSLTVFVGEANLRNFRDNSGERNFSGKTAD
jgi:hypothetical protein